MGIDCDSKTGSTLFGLLKDPSDGEAWQRFVDRYAPKIYRWCRRWGLQHADAEEVTGQVLHKLVRELRTFKFKYDPSKSGFRSWLKTVTRHTWINFLKVTERAGRGAGGPSQEDIEAVPSDDWEQMISQIVERECFERAVARVQLRVKRKTWEAFQLLVFEGLSGAEVARQLDMTVAAVFMAKKRVQQMLKQEIQDREDGSQAERWNP